MELSEEARRKRNEYQRKWRRENPDKVRQAQARYWNRQAQGDSEGQKAADSGKDGQHDAS